MATAKRDLTNPPVQGHTVHPLDKMIAIAVRIAEREGLLLENSESKTSTAVEGGNEVVKDAREQDRRTA